MSTLTTMIHYCTGNPNQRSKARNCCHTGRRRKDKTVSIHTDETGSVENLKECSRKLLELINEFVKTAGYKVNMQKPIIILYINNKQLETKINKYNIHNGTKNIKYLGINLRSYM